MIGLDTNALLRLFINDNPDQSKSIETFFAQQESACYINIIVLCEMVWALRKSYKHSKPQIIMVVKALIESDDFVVENEIEVADAIDLYEKSSAIELADILIALRNKKAGCKITYSFDKHAAKLDEFTLLA